MSVKAKNAAIRLLALALCLCLACALAACQPAVELPVVEESLATNSAATVYYLNPRPEQDAQWQALAALYTKETKVPVTVVSPEAGSYEAFLAEEMTKIEAPTLLSADTLEELSAWEDYIWDLTESELYADLGLKMLALEKDGTVLALPYGVNAYGLLADNGLLKLAGLSAESINSFDALENRRVFQECACNCNTLFLAARQQDSTFANLGINTIWQCGNKIVQIRHFDCGL